MFDDLIIAIYAAIKSGEILAISHEKLLMVCKLCNH